MRTTIGFGVIAILVISCSSRDTQPPGQVHSFDPMQPTQGNDIQPSTIPPAAPAFTWEPTVSMAGGVCTVGQAASLGGKEGRLRSLQIGFGRKGGLIAWPMDNDHAQLIPVNPDGTVTQVGSVVEMTSASNLSEILALGDSFMLSTHAVCPDKKFFFKCLHHRLLGDRGQTLGTESTTVTTEWIGMEHTERVADNEIMRLWSFMYIPPVLHSFAGNGGNLTVTGVAELKGAGEIVNAEAFAVDGNHWYAVLSDETGEDGHLFVSKAGAGTKMSWLPSSHRVIAMNRAQTGFGLLYRIGDNPSKGGRMAMISLDGKRMGDPVKLKPGPLPAPFADEMTASLSVKKKTLWMTRQDAAGRKIGDPVQVGVGLRGNRDEAPYDVAWTGSGFVATYATIEGGQWRFYAVPITCSGPAR